MMKKFLFLGVWLIFLSLSAAHRPPLVCSYYRTTLDGTVNAVVTEISSASVNPAGNWNAALSSVTVVQSGNWEVKAPSVTVHRGGDWVSITDRLNSAVLRSTLNAPGTVPTLAAGSTMFIINEAANANVWFDDFHISFSSSAANGVDPFDEVQIGYSISGSTQLFIPRLVRRLLNDITTDRAPPGFSITSLTTTGSAAIYFSFKQSYPARTPNLQIWVTNLNPDGKDLRINAYAATWRR